MVSTPDTKICPQRPGVACETPLVCAASCHYDNDSIHPNRVGHSNIDPWCHMKRVVVTEIDPKNAYNHARYIWFDLPGVTEPGGYRAIMSYNAFFSGRKKRNHAPISLLLYTAAIDDDIDFMLKYSYHIHVPNIVVKTIWDFYALIGYDHKRNKYERS